MSLLSRFRRTVLPSNPRSKNFSAENDSCQYNYRKSTKTFNEKSVKPKNSQLCADSKNGINYNDVNEKLKSSTISTKKLSKNKPEKSFGGSLSRSNTFTLEDEANIENQIYSQSYNKGKFSSYKHNTDDISDEPNANNVNKDVFETLYLKRSLKSSHSPKSSNEEIHSMDEKPSSFTRPTTLNKCYSSLNRNSSSMRSERPREYLFGSTFERKIKDEPEKENVYKTNYNNSTNDKNHLDRFKTITINNLRRSFRDTFLAKPGKGREHQQVWFINVKEKQDDSSDNKDQHTIDDNDEYVGGNRQVKRNETFRVDTNRTKKESKNNAIGRRETFRINRDQSPVQSLERVSTSDSNSCITLNYRTPMSGKLIPIGITAPYNASNEIDTYSNSSVNWENNNKKKYYNDDELTNENYPQQHPYAVKLFKNRNDAPTQTRTIDEYTSFHMPKNMQTITFPEHKLPERKNSNPCKNRLMKSQPQNKKPNSKIIANPSLSNTFDVTDNFNISQTSTPNEPWRSISNRRLSKDNITENRSFVPYFRDYNKYEDLASKPKSYNRTTINISGQKPKPNYDQSINKIIIPLTSNKLPSMLKSKQNKNRSVNFPSVECEVRLISPNHDIKPRRKAKPANDWSFNKVHL